MQLIQIIWAFCIQLADYPARLSHQLSSSIPFSPLLFDLEQQASLHDVANSCINSPSNRSCWTHGFDIDTDYEKNIPNTGVTNKYNLVLSNGYWAGDGYNVSRLLINNTYPGPTIEGNWGDEFEITVHNQLTNDNGTSIHWHGIRQLHTNYEDGVAGVTQCPIPPNGKMTYKWRAWQYGTSWYHSHFSLQYPDGIAGPLVLHGPTSANYDVDLGPLMITDWYHEDAFSLEYPEFLGKPAPPPESKLMNGTYGGFKCLASDPKCDPQASSTYTVTFEKGKRYKWGIVNTSAGTHYTFWVDGHNFTVVTTDLVAIKPYTTNVLNVAIGQRYEIIVEANADTTNQTSFWINMRNCQLTDQIDSPYTGIIRYDPASTAAPPLTAYDPGNGLCQDPTPADLIPVVPWTIPIPPAFQGGDSLYVSDNNITRNGTNIFAWEIANSTLYLNWSKPALTYSVTNENFPATYAPIFIDGGPDDYVYFVIEGNFTRDKPDGRNPVPVAHPIHLHGHDFVLLEQSSETFDPNYYTLSLDNPTRRDVAQLPVDGYIIIGFKTDNPGVWLMHCHIAFHASAGLALQFIENRVKIPALLNNNVRNDYNQRCAAWGAFYDQSPAKQADSGI